MGRGGGSGGWRGSDEHLMLVNAPVQEKPDAPGFAELVHLRALNALKSPPPHYVKFFFIKNNDKQQQQQEQGPPPQWRPFKYYSTPQLRSSRPFGHTVEIAICNGPFTYIMSTVPSYSSSLHWMLLLWWMRQWVSVREWQRGEWDRERGGVS